MKRQTNIVVVAMVLTILFLTATTSAFADENKSFMTGTLRLVGPGFTTYDDVVDPVSGEVRIGHHYLIELFEETYPNMKLEIEAIPWDSWMAKLQAAATGEQADVLVHGGTMVDVVEDMMPYLEQSPELLELLFTQGTYRRADANNYTQLSCTAVPIGLNAYVICYDKSIFDNFGVEYPNANDTWQTFLEKLKAITGENPVTGEMCYGSTINMTATNLWRPFVSYNWSNNIHVTEFADKKFESKILYNTPEVIESFKFLQELGTTFAPGYLEKVGFERFGTKDNNVGVYLDVMPLRLYQLTVANNCVDQYGYAPYPKIVNNDGRAFFLGDWNMAIPKTSANKEAAWEFIKWMITDERVADYVLETGNLPNSKKAIENLAAEGYPFAEAFSQNFENFPPFFWANSSVYYDNLFGSVETIFSNYVIPLYEQKLTPEETAAAIQKELEEMAESMK
ncbi:MAG: extracellular solute-binding protein [Christensenellales bacterium]|jgi:multiple sugar transport system substrate-binding protein